MSGTEWMLLEELKDLSWDIDLQIQSRLSEVEELLIAKRDLMASRFEHEDDQQEAIDRAQEVLDSVMG